MAPVLRLTVRPFGPIPSFGNRALLGGCIAFPLASVVRRMVGRRDRLAVECPLPPDPEAVAAARGYREQRAVEKRRYGHQEYLALVEATPPVEAALARDEDYEVAAQFVLCPGAAWQVEKHCRPMMHTKEYTWVECHTCGRRYTAGECAHTDWSLVADVLAGIGGFWLECPAGHAIISLKTWVS